MKSKLRKICCIIFALIFTFAFSACGNGGDSKVKSAKLMNGFELFDRDVQTVKLFNSFGRIEQNDNLEYVKSGSSSLHIQPFGGRIIANTANPYIILPTTSARFTEVAFSDFSDVRSISFWIFNAEKTEQNVGVSLQIGEILAGQNRPAIGASRVDRAQRTVSEYYTLKSGWNYVEYEVRAEYLELCALDIDNKHFNIKEVLGVALEFDYVWSNDFADAPDLYLDDVKVNYGENRSPLDISIVEKDLGDGLKSWTLCDFETLGQTYYFYSRISSMPAAAQPVVKQVFSGEYGALAPDNGYSLLTLRKHGAGQTGDYVGIFLNGQVFTKAFEVIGEDVKNNPQNYAIKFDCYNASSITSSIALGYGGSKSQSSFTLKAKEWTQCTAPSFAHLNNYLADGNRIYTENPGWLRFAWGDYSSSGNYSDIPILIDDIRIEKIA